VAKKISPVSGREDHGGPHDHRRANRGQWREPAARPTRAPHGEVLWWERPPPEASDAALWRAVQRIHARRQQLDMSVSDLARRLAATGTPIRRETVSRVLNGKQPTTWETAERMADILGITLAENVSEDPVPPAAPSA
jgi:ribosome-binding protein aMBF1 (putative translation factor)